MNYTDLWKSKTKKLIVTSTPVSISGMFGSYTTGSGYVGSDSLIRSHYAPELNKEQKELYNKIIEFFE